MWAKRKITGFTIVELLIVIVVIAVLASITVVAYNGIQNRAKNQQTVQAVRAYYNAWMRYAVDNGVYPTSRGCLGQSNFYASNPCYIGGATYNYSSVLNDAVAPYITNQPNLPSGLVTNGSVTGSGIFYEGNAGYIGFPIFGTTTCPSIAGASAHTATIAGSDVYCRILLSAA